MSPSRPLLIFLWLFLNPVLGYPVAKRLSSSGVGEDVLAGSDFLSVFMKTSPARSVAPSLKFGNIFGAKTRNSDYSETNSVVQKNKEDVNLFTDINLKGEDALESNSHETVDDSPPLENSEELIKSNFEEPELEQDTMTTTEKNVTDSITVSPTTATVTEDVASTYYDLEEEHPSIVQGFRDDRSTKPTVTQYWQDPQSYLSQSTPVITNSSDQPLQVISVRVSSSVVRHTHKVEDPLKGFESEKIKPPSTLVTQEQPTNTAIQRSHLNVEEATLPDEQPTYHEIESTPEIKPPLPVRNPGSFRFSSLSKSDSNEDNLPKIIDSEVRQENSENVQNFRSDIHQSEAEEEEIKIQQTDFLKIPQNQNQTVIQREKPASILKSGSEKEETDEDYLEVKTKLDDGKDRPQALPYRYSPESEPSELSSSGYDNEDYLKREKEGKKSDYSEDKSQSTQNGNEPRALAYQYNPQNPQLSPVSYHTSVSSATSGSRVQFYREPPSYRRGNAAETVQRSILADPKREFQYPPPPTPSKPTRHEEPLEKSYEIPEQNYEVDESISVVTNGRTHGIQVPTPTPTQESSEGDQNAKDDNNKFGYVVEGRNFRKYRVEERTADGFIVGEYGVVSHDDGSLRGVRYTADSTINPRLIYDALVKFLSLK
ncbi:uncharacterized protein LOC142326851 [Lycorma delicatula]|uniref:uncharacterized protein LOC142326851 n=1 Tax=Lycorma delicatula TaxID=130591 RepID=UPI003F512F32